MIDDIPFVVVMMLFVACVSYGIGFSIKAYYLRMLQHSLIIHFQADIILIYFKHMDIVVKAFPRTVLAKSRVSKQA